MDSNFNFISFSFFVLSSVPTCKNGGTCSQISTYPYYSCSCPTGYTGSQCQTSTSSTNTCADNDPYFCQIFATNGFCSSVRELCKKSCNNCYTIPTTCADQLTNCAAYFNYCEIMPEFKNSLCQKTCKYC